MSQCWQRSALDRTRCLTPIGDTDRRGTVTAVVEITLDGRTVSASEGELLVHAAARHGTFIPTLCHDDKLVPYGGCRMCVVEVEELVRPAARRLVEVLREEHLRQRALELGDRAVRRHDHSLGDAGCTGGQRTRCALDVDDAHAAPAVRVELVVVAERRDERAVAGGRVDQQLPFGRAHRTAVERELDHQGDPRWLMPRDRRLRGGSGPDAPDRASGRARPWHQPSGSRSRSSW